MVINIRDWLYFSSLLTHRQHKTSRATAANLFPHFPPLDDNNCLWKTQSKRCLLSSIQRALQANTVTLSQILTVLSLSQKDMFTLKNYDWLPFQLNFSNFLEIMTMLNAHSQVLEMRLFPKFTIFQNPFCIYFPIVAMVEDDECI